MNRNPKPHVYFIRPIGQDGPIKVGHSIQVPLRLQEYNKWSPIELEVAAMLPIPSAFDDWGFVSSSTCVRFERRFHLRYEAHRLHHEWFAVHPTILADIDNINAGAFDPGCLPEWRKVKVDFLQSSKRSRGLPLFPAPGSRAAVSREPTLSPQALE
jgi:hypothetical protein